MSDDMQGVKVQETSGGNRVREHTSPGRLAQRDGELAQRVSQYLDASPVSRPGFGGGF